LHNVVNSISYLPAKHTQIKVDNFPSAQFHRPHKMVDPNHTINKVQ